MSIVWSEITFGSNTIWQGPYLVYRSIFTQNGRRNFTLEIIEIFWFFYGSFYCIGIDNHGKHGRHEAV